MWGTTSTLGPLPWEAAVMRSVIGDSFLKAANATGRRCPFAQKHPNPEAPPKTRREGEGKGGGGRKKKGGKEGREERRILGSVWE